MPRLTHRLFYHDGHGFFAKRELEPDYRPDGDGYAVWTEADEMLLADAAQRTASPSGHLRKDLQFMDVVFVPKDGFEQTGLEALTDDPTVCPDGQWAAFSPIR